MQLSLFSYNEFLDIGCVGESYINDTAVLKTLTIFQTEEMDFLFTSGHFFKNLALLNCKNHLITLGEQIKKIYQQ